MRSIQTKQACNTEDASILCPTVSDTNNRYVRSRSDFTRPQTHQAAVIHKMAPKVSPPWVKELKPSGPQGSELLQKERNASNLDVRRLSEFIHTKEEIQRKDRILEVLTADKVFDKSQNYFAGRIDRFEMSLARAKRLRQLTVEHKWSAADFILANELLSESTPYRLHDSMFLVS